MKPTSRQTYRIVRAMLNLRKFTQYKISKEEKVAFSLVNRVVNWFLARGYIAKRPGYYELVSPAAIFSIFPLYRKLKPYGVIDVDMPKEQLFALLGGKAKLCLTSALSYYDNSYRDPALCIYLDNSEILSKLKQLPKGYLHIELYKEDLSSEDFVIKNGVPITTKARTVIDLFCANKAYSTEHLIKREWI